MKFQTQSSRLNLTSQTSGFCSVPRINFYAWSLALLLGVANNSQSFAQEVSATPIAKKGAQLVSDDFERKDLGSWKATVPTFTVADGVLKGSQTRDDHGAVGAVRPGNFKDCVIEFKFRFEGSTSINAVCDDKDFKGSHAGHICRVAITPKQIRLGDDKEGVMRNDIFEMRKDPAKKAEADKLLVGRGKAINTKIDARHWYKMTIEIVGEQMRVSLDDKAIGSLQSPGFAHATKNSFHFTVNGKDALFDDVRIWAAESVAAK